MNSKTRVTILCAIVSLIIAAIGALIFLAYRSYLYDQVPSGGEVPSGEVAPTNNLSSGVTGGEVNIDDTSTTTSSDLYSVPTTSSKTTSSSSSSTSTSSLTSATTTKKTTTSKKPTTKTSTTKTSSTTKTTTSTVAGPTTYPNALGDWEDGILNMINAERQKNNLNPVIMSANLRSLAEYASDVWESYGDDDTGFKEFLRREIKHSSYGQWSNQMEGRNYNYFYNLVKEKTNITTNKTITSVGIAVIYKAKGYSDIPTYYFMIIYE